MKRMKRTLLVSAVVAAQVVDVRKGVHCTMPKSIFTKHVAKS